MGKSREEMERAGREIERAAETRALEFGGLVFSVVPLIGGPVSNVLGGMAQQRKLDRVKEVVDRLSASLADFKSEVTDQYVRTEDFEDLLDKTLRIAAEERQADTRALYVQFLRRAITEPGDEYDEQLEVLRVLERVRPQHIVIMKATQHLPSADAHRKHMGSPVQTLRERTGLDDAAVRDAVAALNDLRLTNIKNLHAMMSGIGSETLQGLLTPLGRRVLEYISD